MSGFGGFGGFGQNNNNQQPQNSGFGFGQSSNTNTGFGSTANTGFGGTTNNTGGLFGSGTTGFGSSGGFGSTAQTGGFGAKPAPGFGAASTGTGLFGTSTANTGGFGGFGSSNTNTSSPFGSTNTTSGLFGQANKPAFGTGASTSSPFGGTATGFGSTSAFGGNAPTVGGVAADCQGTGSTPFQAYVEKEPNSTSNQQNSYQSISFQQPYQKWSPEELRLADYVQGRRFGNASGQAGAFGTNTGFGGFGNTNTTNAFGSGTNTSSNLFGGTPFGQNTQSTTTGFGTNTTSSPFGKPATTTSSGLFSAPTQTAGATGLFGNTGTTGFGTNTNTTGFGASSAGSIFGANNNNQNKPTFSFGASNTGTGFGTNTGTAGFGNAFGSATQSQATLAPFGAPAQPATNNTFGSFGTANTTQAGTGLFGSINNQAKPATGIFGAPNISTGTGIFGSNTTSTAPNPFGATSTTANNPFASKPANTGTSNLFVANNNTTNTGSVFGTGFGTLNNQNQQQQNNPSGSLFGSLNAGQQSKPPFGVQAQQGGTSLFGGNNQQNTSSVFGTLGNTQNQQNLQTSFGTSSLLGSQQAQPSMPQSLTASISDPTAFGTASMFSNLTTPDISNPGPLATPLSKLSKQKKSPALPMLRMNPGSTSRFNTPQKRGFQGFGFSYSTYGTPGSVSSTSSTPLLTMGNSAFGGGFKGLRGSMSTSSLRGSYNSTLNPGDSILAPGAFSISPGVKYKTTGSLKSLKIDPNFKCDLFQPPSRESSSTTTLSSIKKKVSFDASTVGGNINGNLNGSTSPLKQVQNSSITSSEELGYIRSPSRNGNKSNGVSSPPEMEQVKGNELAIVHEEVTAPATASSGIRPVSQEDQVPGDYWMRPKKEEILSMNRMQRQKVSGFTVGRDGVGEIIFDEPVDLSSINIDELFENFISLDIRKATVYPDSSKKPPVGKGLNVPSTIRLMNSWPRGKRTQIKMKKHIERLSRVPETKFLNYDEAHGIWIFKVAHFTTYGVPDDDDETDVEGISEFGQSTLSAPPDTPTPKSRTPNMPLSNQSFVSTSDMSNGGDSMLDDTFDFKKKILPGAFDNQEAFVEEDDHTEDEPEQNGQSFLDDRSTGSQSDIAGGSLGHDDVFRNQELVRYEDQDMAGSYPQFDRTVEHDENLQEEITQWNAAETPGAVMRTRMRAMQESGSTNKRKLRLDDNDWTEMLRQTISPQKQDRAQLKQMIESMNDGALIDFEGSGVAANPGMRIVSEGRGFATSIDLMHSLFGEAKSPVKALRAPSKKGFEWPYAKKSKTSDLDESNIDVIERAFHDSVKPRWSAGGTLVFAGPSDGRSLSRSLRSQDRESLLIVQRHNLVSDAGDVRFARFSSEFSADMLKKQKLITAVSKDRDVPFARLNMPFKFTDFFDGQIIQDPAAAHEKLVWDLASVLFDPPNIPEDLQAVPNSVNLLRKDNLSVFWQKLVDQASSRYVAMARSSEEKAIACLSGHRIADACGHLLNGKDFHLTTLIALIGSNETVRRSIREQLNEWHKSRVLSEFSQPIRALYEILAGNVCVCDGTKGAHIEDRMESFTISERFGLDWRQAFGLRLWYAINASDDFTRAVQMFANDLKLEKETAKPRAWYIEQGISPLWDDQVRENREDLLWGLLKLYCDRTVDLEAVLRPGNSQLSPLNVRLSWQLSCALTSSENCSYGDDADEKADQLTLSFASQLTNEGNWLDATFVLLHLSTASVRAKTIQDHLAYHAGRIGPEDGQAFTILTQDYLIPAPWVWESKALYMRSVQKDPRREVECLLNAEAYNEAHRTFSREVAPKAVIEEDWGTLQALISGFKGRESSIAEWSLGGQLYVDYLALIESQKKGFGRIDGMVLERLLASLPAMVLPERHPSFLETVAVQEISGVVSRVVAELAKHGHKKDTSILLTLPLTEDKYLKHTIDLSVGYYKSIMAGGR